MMNALLDALSRTQHPVKSEVAEMPPPQLMQQGWNLTDLHNAMSGVASNIGTPMDLMTLAMRPLGYDEPAPFMGSEWVGQQLGADTGSKAFLGGQIGGFDPMDGVRLAQHLPDLMNAMSAVAPAGAVAGQRIAQRFPTGKTATDDPHDQSLRVDIATAQREPEKLAHNVSMLERYTPLRDAMTVRSTEDALGQYTDMVSGNLKFLHDKFDPELRGRASQWYVGANRISNEASRNYGIPVESAAGVYAALSPQKDWFMNVSLGDRVIDIWSRQNELAWTKEMAAYAPSILDATRPVHLALLRNISGKRLSDLTDPVEKAAWIRLYDETHNPRQYHIISPEGDRMGLKMTGGENARPAKPAWGSYGQIANAVKALESGGDMRIISPAMGDQHKVRNFYNNIADPWAPDEDVTMDTHAVGAGLLQPLSGADIAVSHNLGSTPPKKLNAPGPANSAITGNQGTYGINADAYRNAAKSENILPRSMQSITWEGIRGLFDNKSPAIRKATGAVWDEYKRGKISQKEAQERVYEIAGGINTPDWAK